MQDSLKRNRVWIIASLQITHFFWVKATAFLVSGYYLCIRLGLPLVDLNLPLAHDCLGFDWLPLHCFSHQSWFAELWQMCTGLLLQQQWRGRQDLLFHPARRWPWQIRLLWMWLLFTLHRWVFYFRVCTQQAHDSTKHSSSYSWSSWRPGTGLKQEYGYLGATGRTQR